MKCLISILLLLLSACGGRQVATAPKEDPRITEEKRLRKMFPDAPYIITRQEQLDSLLVLADARIAAQPSPEAYLTRLSLYSAGLQWEKELQDAQAGLALLQPADTSELAIKLHFAKASALSYLNRPADAVLEYRWIIANADSASVSEARECLTGKLVDEAYIDSISMITGIAPESPYWYDPSWGITYSSKMGSLLYYPREQKSAYFTIPSSVLVIDDRAFQCNLHLKEIIIPEGVIEVGTGAFLSSKKLRIVTIRGRIEDLPWRTFDDCQKLASVELPWSLTSIGGLAFGGCKNLRRIVIRNPEPPNLEGCEPREDIDETWPFAGVDTDRCVLQVPFGSVKKYREAPGWSRFRHIEGNIKPIPHRWVELDSTLLAGYGIAPGDIERWKQYFDRKFRFNTLDADQIKYYQSENHFVSVNDLSALLFDQGNDSIPKQNCTLWRLLQYASQRGIRFPFNPDQLLRVLRIQIDSVLSYGAWSTIDMSTRAALEETLRAWYNDLLLSRIKAVSSPELRSCLEKEEEAWKTYHDKAMTAYERLNDNTGSISFTYFCNFGSMDQQMRHLGVEEYYSAVFAGVLFPRSPGTGRHGIVTDAAVSQAYQEFRKDVPDWGELEPLPSGLYTQRQMRAALTTEQRSWEAWMAARAAVSELLSGEEKAAWDNATNNVRRYKRITLMNRYENPDREPSNDLLKFD